jgi:hypothetical protein
LWTTRKTKRSDLIFSENIPYGLPAVIMPGNLFRKSTKRHHFRPAGNGAANFFHELTDLVLGTECSYQYIWQCACRYPKLSGKRYYFLSCAFPDSRSLCTACRRKKYQRQARVLNPGDLLHVIAAALPIKGVQQEYFSYTAPADFLRPGSSLY